MSFLDGYGYSPFNTGNLPTFLKPTPFSQSPPVVLLKRAFNFITNPGLPPGQAGPANTGPVQSLGTAARLIPSLMAGSGASQATPNGSAAAAPVKPPIGSLLAPGVAGASAPPSVPMPQPRPAMPNAPMSLAPPSPGPSAPTAAPPVNPYYNGPGSMSFGASPVLPGGPSGGMGSGPSFQVPGMAQQQPTGQQQNYRPTGIIPKAVNDFGMLKKLFAGGGPSVSGSAIY